MVVFGKQAESCAQYLKKGSTAHVEGRIQTRSWETEDKGKQYRAEIIADRVQFGPRPGAVNGPKSDVAPESDTDQRPRLSGAGEAPASAAPIPYPEEEDIDISNIPF